jgi:CRISPR-associated endonuclease Csn1
MAWRLGLDLGTNSIGWAALELTPDGKEVTGLIDMGVTIFPDGREPQQGGRIGDSLAVTRRLARSARRNRDRGKNRKARLMGALVAAGLMPAEEAARKDLEALDPYELRARAVDEPLTPEELGRALFHLGLRRGFKSNRKTDKAEESGKQAERIAQLRGALDGRTLGQHLWAKLRAGEPIRFREGVDFFPERAMYEAEFDAIRAQQEPHHTATPARWEEIRECVFFQHPLRPVERGRCEFFPDEDRAHKDLPIAQTFRILQELNNLRWIDAGRREHPLDPDQRDHILAKLNGQGSYKFTAMRRAKGADGQPLFPGAIAFNLEDERRKDLAGHKTNVDMAKPAYLGDVWAAMPEKARNDLFEALHDAESDEDIIDEAAEWGLTAEQAARAAAYPLASQTVKVSRKFMERICPVLHDTGLVYAEAVTQVTGDDGQPLHHSHRPPGELLARLPYYGAALRGATMGEDPEADPEGAPEKRFGRIANPTVHVALNQLRRLVNALIDRLGPPAEIHVEVGRELKQSREDRNATTKRIGANQRENIRIADFCIEHGEPSPSARDIRKVKLWEELGKEQIDRRCLYSGRVISAAMLFNGEAEIEHILPFSRTLDNGQSNMTLSLRWANQLKGDKTPFEAFGDDRRAGKEIVWGEVLARVEALPEHKRWRFGPGAMEKFEKDGGFIKRQLTDNAYIARSAGS